MAKSNSKGMLPNGRRGHSGERYIKALHAIFDHPDYLSMEPAARLLLWELARQYNGHNNGDLSLAPKVMGRFGWNKSTIQRHKDSLINNNWIFIAGAKPARNGWVYLYALTWLDVNECGGKLFDESTNHKTRSLKIKG